MVPAGAAVEGQEEVEVRYRISTCDYSAPAALVAIVARRESHSGLQDVPHLAAKEAEEDLLLSKAAGWVLGAEVVVEGHRSLWEATVRSLVVEQTAPVAEEERVEGWERLVVGPREVVVAPGLLRRLGVPLRRHLVARPRSQRGWIYPRSRPSQRDTDGKPVLEGRRAALASRPWSRWG